MKIVNAALILSVAMTAASAIPSFAQYPSWDPRWQGPVWQQSTNGEFYDATGTVKGTVPGHMLGQFGGRIDGGPSVGAPYMVPQQQRWFFEKNRRHRRAGAFVPIW